MTTAINLSIVYSLLAFSVHLAIRAGMFSLASVAFYGTGAYTAAILVPHIGTIPALLVAVGQAAVLGFVLSLMLGRLHNLYLAMATIACVLLVRILAIEAGDVTGGALGIFGIRSSLTATIALVFVVGVAAAVAFVERGRSGRTLEAVRIDGQLAASAGIDVVRVKRMAFTASCAMGGLAGATAAFLFRIITPDDASFKLIVDALTMLVIGGSVAWYGPVIGAVIVAWLPQLLAFSEGYRLVIQALVVIVVLIFLPNGLAGVVQTMIARARRLVVGRRGRLPVEPPGAKESQPTLATGEEPRS